MGRGCSPGVVRQEAAGAGDAPWGHGREHVAQSLWHCGVRGLCGTHHEQAPTGATLQLSGPPWTRPAEWVTAKHQRPPCRPAPGRARSGAPLPSPCAGPRGARHPCAGSNGHVARVPRAVSSPDLRNPQSNERMRESAHAQEPGRGAAAEEQVAGWTSPAASTLRRKAPGGKGRDRAARR